MRDRGAFGWQRCGPVSKGKGERTGSKAGLPAMADSLIFIGKTRQCEGLSRPLARLLFQKYCSGTVWETEEGGDYKSEANCKIRNPNQNRARGARKEYHFNI